MIDLIIDGMCFQCLFLGFRLTVLSTRTFVYCFERVIELILLKGCTFSDFPRFNWPHILLTEESNCCTTAFPALEDEQQEEEGDAKIKGRNTLR